MVTMCEECDHSLVGDEVEHLYEGKSYCKDYYKAIKAAMHKKPKPAEKTQRILGVTVDYNPAGYGSLVINNLAIMLAR
jgi:hypothetical protein